VDRSVPPGEPEGVVVIGVVDPGDLFTDHLSLVEVPADGSPVSVEIAG